MTAISETLALEVIGDNYALAELPDGEADRALPLIEVLEDASGDEDTNLVRLADAARTILGDILGMEITARPRVLFHPVDESALAPVFVFSLPGDGGAVITLAPTICLVKDMEAADETTYLPPVEITGD